MTRGAGSADAAADERAAYIHIPFCRRRCPYCDFAVVDLSQGPHNIDHYVKAVVAEIQMEPAWGNLHAINVGGGTPSALAPDQVARLIAALNDRFGIVDGAEVSIEANPEDWTVEYAAALAGIGVNRVSLGIQSFDQEVLDFLGRRHTPGDASAAVAAAQEAGIRSVNVDLIFGSPVESLESWHSTVARTLELAPDHVSAYALTVEKGTALSRAVQTGAPAPDGDDQADKYEAFADAAANAGLERYEISNWARAGHRCRYNSTTWAYGEYAAFGTGAHGFRSGARTRNVRRLDRYLEAIDAGNKPVAGTEILTGWERDRERVFVGLRRTGGVHAGVVGRAFLNSAPGKRLIDAGILTSNGDRLLVTNPLLSDAVARELLALTDPNRSSEG
jgi:putative oxygen-independent coproporphyrinogen III oxidase